MYKYKAAFGSDGKSVVAVAYDGTYFKYVFRENDPTSSSSSESNLYVLEKTKFLPRDSY